MFKSFANALFPQIHTQSNYDFEAKTMKGNGKRLSQSPIKKSKSRQAAMGVGDRTKKGAPAPGQGDKPNVELGEPSEPGDMSPAEKKQVQNEEPSFAGKKTPVPKQRTSKL